MNDFIPLVVIVPLLGAALCVVAARSRRVQRVVSLVALSSNVITAILLLLPRPLACRACTNWLVERRTSA